MKIIKNRSKDQQGMLSMRQRGFAVGTLALALVAVLMASYGIIQITEYRAHSSAKKLVSEVVTHIDDKLNEVSIVTREAALTAGAQLDDPDALERLVFNFVSGNSFVYGSTVAFEPDAFPGRGRCFAPYSWRTEDGQVHSRQLGTETDYYQEEWYAETKLSMEEYWCEPYFDEGGAKIMMCTFSIPLKDSRGRLAAVMTADVGLADLEEYIASITPDPDTVITLRSRQGNILASGEGSTESSYGDIIIKGITETGWTVELSLPFAQLMRGDTGAPIYIVLILLITLVFIYFINRLLLSLQQRSSAEYRKVIDSITSAYSSIYLVNLLTDETVVFRDPGQYGQILGGLKDEGSSFKSRISRLIEYDCHPADIEMMYKEASSESFRANLAKQDRYSVRFRKEHEGETDWHEMHVFVLERDESACPKRAVIAFTDVNRDVQKEKEIQDTLESALKDARAADRAKTNFLFNMSHDIRTPMNAILGFTSMARKHIDDTDRVLDCLDKTQQSGNLLLALINSVLDVSRIESGQAKLTESPADVALSFAAISDTLTELAAARDIELSFSLDNIRDRFVYADLDRCNRVFVNIISNAIKYTHEGGRVTVTCTQLDSAREGFGEYCYTFEDNGIGMSEEFQKTVFEQFTRERSTTVSGIEGSGLGLAVCKSFTELMGGTIECRSKLGEGTTFTVTLPFRLQEGRRYVDPYTREEVSVTDAVQTHGTLILSGRKVLLVEDNELNREIAEEILEEEGMQVESAEDGTDAVELLKTRGPEYYDFILMDIQMPVMNGYEATKVIREMYPDARIPVIAVSANAFEEDRRASKEAGMDEHVAKPINVSELFNVLARYL